MDDNDDDCNDYDHDLSEMCKTPLESVSSEYFSSLIQVFPDYFDDTKITLEYDSKYLEPKKHQSANF